MIHLKSKVSVLVRSINFRGPSSTLKIACSTRFLTGKRPSALPSPVYARFHNADVQGEGEGDMTPRASKLGVVELSEKKNSGLVSTSTREWCDF